MRAARPRRRLLPLAQLLVSVLFVGALVWWAARQEAPAWPEGADALAYLLLALAIYAAATVARGERWERIVRAAEVPLARSDAYGLTTVGYMGNNVLPARGGDLLRVLLLGKLADRSRRSVLGTVVAERLLDALSLVILFVVVAYGLLREADVAADAGWSLAAIGAAAVAAAAATLVVRATAALRRLREFLRPVAAATLQLVGARGLALLALSLVIWTLEASVYVAVASAVDLDLGLLGALYVVAFTNLFALVPAGPGYAGTYDAAVVLAVGALGHSASEALGYLLLLRFVLFVPITLVGFGLLVARYGGWARLRALRSAGVT